MFDFSDFLIASDLDGTLLNKQGTVPQRNLDAIAYFCANGGKFTLNTGRTHHSIRSAVGNVEGLVNAPVVHCNGAYLYDFHQKEFSSELFMPEAHTRALLDFLQIKHPELPFRAMARHQIRYYIPPGHALPEKPMADPGTLCDDPVATWPLTDWYKLVLLGVKDIKEQISRELIDDTGIDYGITTSGTTILEIQVKGCNKAVGLEKLRRHYAPANGRCVIACGDYDNDVPALMAADVAVCPENANEKAKAHADHVLCHCNDGLIADIVEEIESGRIKKQFKGNTV